MKLLDVLNAPWAILPEKKREIDAIYATHLRGEKIDLKAIEATLGRPLNNPETTYDVRNGVAVIDVSGVIAKRMNLFTAISGGVSTEMIGKVFQNALDDPAVASILLNIDSPGGSVDGPPNLANTIYAARDRKPIVALADGVMASAAYWIGAAASQIFAASRTTQVGSIGVVATHLDVSGLEAARGVKTTEIVSGKYKRMASSYAPLSVEGRQSIQDQTDYLYSVFLDAVATFRGMASTEDVHATMADGRIFFAEQAQAIGMVDGVATLDELLARMADGEFAEPLPTGATRAVSRGAHPKLGAGDASHPTTTKEVPMADSKDRTITAEDAKPHVDAAVAIARTEFSAKEPGLRKEGADAERARIQAVLGQALAGHDTLIQTLAFDGKTTGPEAAVAVLQAERGKKAQMATDLKADAPKPAAHAVAPAPGTEKTDEERAKENAKVIDPAAVAQKARTYIAEQHKLGITVSAEAAVAHVTAEAK